MVILKEIPENESAL